MKRTTTLTTSSSVDSIEGIGGHRLREGDVWVRNDVRARLGLLSNGRTDNSARNRKGRTDWSNQDKSSVWYIIGQPLGYDAPPHKLWNLWKPELQRKSLSLLATPNFRQSTLIDCDNVVRNTITDRLVAKSIAAKAESAHFQTTNSRRRASAVYMLYCRLSNLGNGIRNW